MRLHFIAIGGSAMHELAIAMHREGHEVSGSDDAFFDPSRSRLQAHGLLPREAGWDPARITAGIDIVILGMHARKENPELLRAKELGIPIRSFPEFVAERSEKKERIVIAGSHGKTSITAMVLHVMRHCGKDPDRLVGARLEGYDGAVKVTDEADRIVIEGDEYLSSPIDPRPKFLWYTPHIALISGIAWDHINVFPRFEDYLDAFRRFIDSIEKGGTLVYCAEDETLKELVEGTASGIETIPYRTPPHRYDEKGCVLLTEEGEVPLRVFGSHNLQNISGALALCEKAGIPAAEFYRAIRDFEGASLRLEELYEKGERTAFRDYAHAPSKVRATVKALRERYPERRLIACLELHTYSSLNPDFIGQYRDSMEGADEAFVFFDPKAAEMKKLAPLGEKELEEAFGHPSLHIHRDMEAMEEELKGAMEEGKGTVLVFMSSGPFQGVELGRLAADTLG